MSVLRSPVDTFTISNVRRNWGPEGASASPGATQLESVTQPGSRKKMGRRPRLGEGGEGRPQSGPWGWPPARRRDWHRGGLREPAPGVASLCHPKRGLSAVPSASIQAKYKVLPLLFCPHSQKVGGTLGSAGVLGPGDSKAECLPSNSGTEPTGVPCAPHVPSNPMGEGVLGCTPDVRGNGSPQTPGHLLRVTQPKGGRSK